MSPRIFASFGFVACCFALPMFTGCAAPAPGDDAQEPVESVDEELSARPPSRECGAVAKKAALALEQLNGARASVSRSDLVDGFSDRETARISIKRQSQWQKKDSYLVSTESMGGSPCYVYGLQVKSQEIDMTDDGAKISGGPSSECSAIAKKAVEAIERVNGHRVTITGTELVAGHSDREIVRVKIEAAPRAGSGSGESDSYLVNTESLGGSPCLVYGLQLKSQEWDLLDTHR